MKTYILVATNASYDNMGRLTNYETNTLINNRFYGSWEEAKEARKRFIERTLNNSARIEPHHLTDNNLNPTDTLGGYIIHYSNGSRLDTEIIIEELNND